MFEVGEMNVQHVYIIQKQTLGCDPNFCELQSGGNEALGWTYWSLDHLDAILKYSFQYFFYRTADESDRTDDKSTGDNFVLYRYKQLTESILIYVAILVNTLRS